MRRPRNTVRRLFGLTLTLVGLMCWNTLPIHLSQRTVQAATRARVAEPTGQPISRAAANGRIAFVSSEGGARSGSGGRDDDRPDRVPRHHDLHRHVCDARLAGMTAARQRPSATSPAASPGAEGR